MEEDSGARPGGFKITRIQGNMVARKERQLLNWLCARLPNWVTPDGLTMFGVFGAVLTFASYVASRADPAFLWLASLGYVMHWFGDSLDGSLARFRRIERPIYGYFVDHTVDAVTNLLLMSGIGFSLDVRMDAALFALLGYYLLCMYVFIKNHLSGVLQLSFIGFGPTELRICLVAITTAMFFFGRVGFTLGGAFFSWYDAILIFAGFAFLLVFLAKMVVGIRELRDPSRSGAKPAQSASMNASRAVK